MRKRTGRKFQITDIIFISFIAVLLPTLLAVVSISFFSLKSEEEKRQVELKNAEKEASEGNAADISSAPDFVSERTTEDKEPEILLFGRPYKETAESARGNTDDDID